ncbi:MAG: serine protease [Pirellulaceae bacterium]
MSSPAAFLRWACADGFDRLRVLRLRAGRAGLLGRAASFWLLLASAALGQFPIRQVPQTWNGPAAPSTPSVKPLPRSESAGPSQSTASPHPSVCRIIVPERDGISYGSGTLIDARGEFGLVVTNWHVVRDAAGQITVEFPEGHKSQAQVIRTDKDWDLAALSILRPQAEPLRITDQAPHKGEWLSIAGYGSGDYRLAGGVCTQYVAPSNDLPYEMIELAAEARQGDSGGPILNQRGEVCGVLFGSGPGYTSGSYGGRVRQFLAAVLPGGVPASEIAPPANQLAVANPDLALSPRAELGPSRIDVPPAPQATALHQSSPTPEVPPIAPGDAGLLTPANGSLAGNLPPLDGFAASDARPGLGRRIHTPLPPREPGGIGSKSGVALGNADLGRVDLGRVDLDKVALDKAPPAQLLAAAWQRLGGTTLFDQTKSVLAILGILAVAVQFWRFSSRPDRDAADD